MYDILKNKEIPENVSIRELFREKVVGQYYDPSKFKLGEEVNPFSSESVAAEKPAVKVKNSAREISNIVEIDTEHIPAEYGRDASPECLKMRFCIKYKDGSTGSSYTARVYGADAEKGNIISKIWNGDSDVEFSNGWKSCENPLLEWIAEKY